MIQTFKEALHDLLHRSKLPAKQIADRAGKNYTRLSNCANDNQDEHLYGKDIPLLTNISENDALIEHMCASVGGVFIRLPKNISGDLGKLVDQLMEMTKDFGELVGTYQVAILDCKITRNEALLIENKVDELSRHLQEFKVDIWKTLESKGHE